MSKSQYEYITEIISHIVGNRLGQLSLPELAASLGVSPGHLQKVFTKWVGITPKQFGRYLSLQYAKDLLSERATATQAALRAGLSGTGRLHDLFVDIEGMTPGEYRDGGAALVISHSSFDTGFGPCLVASTPRGVCNVLFGETREKALVDLMSRWPKATLVQKARPSHAMIRSYLGGIMPEERIKLHVHGTNFQLKVWEALLSVPEGTAATYGDIAHALGDKNRSRAVGTALGNNPVGYLIPCHRVLKATGEVGGYRWGTDRKRAMLGLEALRRNEQ